MSPADPSRHLATAADLLATPEGRAVEIVGGEIVDKAMPSFEHGSAQSGLSGALFGFRGPPGGTQGPGGWWLATEVDVEYETHEIYRHDLVGWRRDRVASKPSERPVTLRPDWVCEVLSASNDQTWGPWEGPQPPPRRTPLGGAELRPRASNDTVKKLRVLHKHGVPHYWLLDPDAGTLRVLRWTRDGYLEALNATADETVRAEPFEAVELSLSAVLGV
jgi:Uma2 family endonuclease